MTDKPQPYQFCDKHMRPNTGPNRCHECFGASPNPTNEPVRKVNTTNPPAKVAENANSSQQNTVLTDPTAQKVVEAAHHYAEAVEAVKLITEQLTGAKELVAALEKQLKGNQELADAAQNELREVTKK